MVKVYKVYLTLETREEAAIEVAQNVLMRANPHGSDLIHNELEKAEITVENLAKYFIEVSKAVTQFWQSCWNPGCTTVMKPHELKNLYLPLIYGVVFSSVGNIQFGNYEYLLTSADGANVDRIFLLNFSATLEAKRVYVKGSIGQIGNRGSIPQTSTMMTILGQTYDSRSTTVNVRDGVSADQSLSGLSALAGLSLIEEAYRILYTGVEEVNFRQVTEVLIDKGLIASKNQGCEKS